MSAVIFLQSPAPELPRPAGTQPDKKPEWCWNPNGTGPGLPVVFFTSAPTPTPTPTPPPPPPPPTEEGEASLPDVFYMKVDSDTEPPAVDDQNSSPLPLQSPPPPPPATATGDAGQATVNTPSGDPAIACPCHKKKSRGVCSLKRIFSLRGWINYSRET